MLFQAAGKSQYMVVYGYGSAVFFNVSSEEERHRQLNQVCCVSMYKIRMSEIDVEIVMDLGGSFERLRSQ